ncbi:GNAT family N-acetyltransferase [Shewanella sp. NIFS-20-20]|uniref:GNAT family N-acetyltransferase n=1 Tax=Shewanella sp. NIFS-20-20 TaxID=2853806 RepID=UPI001C4678B9|nr:GNAT family N-acetyltransferase [Shewanella sp. NIFS-20-20]MBV7317339.1 GNAT family N-acetyltransferase [Shewanella sp. NIFS-20-20]
MSISHQYTYIETQDPELIRQAAALIDQRDDNAHPLDHDSFCRSRAVIVALKTDGSLVGCAAIKEGAGDVAEMGYLVVHPDYRRQGIAQRLTQERVRRARAVGVKLLWATVRDENQASKANLLKAGWTFWHSFYSVRGTGNIIDWFYMPLMDDVDVDTMMQTLVGSRVMFR